jgi:putative ABC transport system substrate-binding protein
MAVGAALAPGAGISQPSAKISRIGVLVTRARPASLDADPSTGTYLKAMRDLGYVEGRNVQYEWRFADEDLRRERVDALAAQLAQANVDVIVTPTTAAAMALRRATATIPIVFTHVADPVGSKLIASLARPGGNATGVSMLQGELGGKQLELLRRVVPKVSRVGLLTNPSNPGNAATVRQVQSAGEQARLRIIKVEGQSPEEIERAFDVLAQEGAEALVVVPDAVFLSQRRHVAMLAAKLRIPALYGIREFVDAGGLMSYGIDFLENWRRAATYVDKILKGAKPAELAVEQPTKLELVLNMRTAKALGIRFSQDVMILADRVID